MSGTDVRGRSSSALLDRLQSNARLRVAMPGAEPDPRHPVSESPDPTVFLHCSIPDGLP